MGWARGVGCTSRFCFDEPHCCVLRAVPRLARWRSFPRSACLVGQRGAGLCHNAPQPHFLPASLGSLWHFARGCIALQLESRALHDGVGLGPWPLEKGGPSSNTERTIQHILCVGFWFQSNMDSQWLARQHTTIPFTFIRAHFCAGRPELTCWLVGVSALGSWIVGRWIWLY
jgi:hypothetical protein